MWTWYGRYISTNVEDTIMKYQRNIYYKYNTCTIEEHVHEISTIIMLIYVKFMKCWAKFKTIVNDEDIRVIQG